MSGSLGKKLCVVGAGSGGLVATKNFLEAGFDVTTFERNNYIGGLWHATQNPAQISVLPGTKSNVSKQTIGFSDFPYPDTVGTFPDAKEQQTYLEEYAENFKLIPHIRLSTNVLRVRLEADGKKWLVVTKSDESKEETHVFDRVLICTGPHTKPNMPELKGADKFKGEIMHAMEFKDPSKYAGKNVLIVGFNVSAADFVEFLRRAGANKIYLSHRRTTRLLPRSYQGKALDQPFTRRASEMMDWLRYLSPTLFAWILDYVLGKMQNDTWPELSKHPAFGPTRPTAQAVSSIPNISDTLAHNLLSGAVESVAMLSHFTGPNTLSLTDGSDLHSIDTIICATGNSFDISALLPWETNPSNPALAPAQFANLRSQPFYSPSSPPLYLYHNILSIQHPHSLAFIGYAIYRRGAFHLFDLITMALAQLWSGTKPMPTREEMCAHTDKHFAYLSSELKKGYVAFPGFAQSREFDRWCHFMAGTGVYERTGWGWEGWKLWWRDYPLYGMLQDGVDSPFALRVFETGEGSRRAWGGARGEMERVNREVGEEVERWRREGEGVKRE